MSKLSGIVCIALCTVFSIKILAQVKPKNGDSVYYRLAGFEVPKVKACSSYTFEIAKGYIDKSEQFAPAHGLTKITDRNRAIIILPAFGETYTWRATYYNNRHKKIGESPLYHVTVKMSPLVDTAQHKLTVIKQAPQYSNMYLLYDGDKVLYDINGNALWCLPTVSDKSINEFAMLRDLKPTKSGTFTFIGGINIYEIDYDGNVLWTGRRPSNVVDSQETYHHEFTKLPNSNYMVCGNELMRININPVKPAKGRMMPYRIDSATGQAYRKIALGTLIEFDSNGKLVWSWKSSDYIANDSTFFKRVPNSLEESMPHMNSFYFDTDKKYIYISYRNASKIVKISYPLGNIIAIYDGTINGHVNFKTQHAINMTKNGELLVFNNNNKVFNPDSITDRPVMNGSELIILKEHNGTYINVWSFSCDVDTLAEAGGPTGGSIYELPDGNIIGSVAGTGRTLIIDRKTKQILWNAINEHRSDVWRNNPQYRVSVISEIEMENIVFSSWK